MAGMVTQLEFATRAIQAGTGPDPIANRQAAYVRRNVYSQLKRAKGVCMQTILGTHAAFLACRLARKKAPELRSVSEACLASLVAHDMVEFRTRSAHLGKLVCEKCRRYACITWAYTTEGATNTDSCKCHYPSCMRFNIRSLKPENLRS